ncbi:MAG: adenylate/guanylate cyclase domain-containing protein [Anaerolineales bacterium]
MDALRRATPQEMAQRITAQKDRLQGERKLVTALFADIVGSTALADSMDPEEWRHIISGSHERASQAVYQFEGTIAQLLGDGVLAFFGAPLAHEDDAERAIRAALLILEKTEAYAHELKQQDKVEDFQMRVGLNTGRVVVGNIGTDLHMEYLAVGDTINLAARLQSAAEPGSIVISERTRRLAGPAFVYEDLGEIEIKGKNEAVHIYRVKHEREGEARSRETAGLVSPLVGRAREYATLLERTKELREGSGSIITIAGEAGLGKSRLVEEWRREVTSGDEETLHWIEGRCPSFGINMAHQLSSDVIRGMIGAPAGSPTEEIRSALRTRIQELLAEETEEIYPYLAHLLGLELEEKLQSKVEYLQGPALQDKYAEAFARLLQAMASEQPTVLVVEDLHWADPSSVDLGLKVLPMVVDVPLIVVLVARPDRDSQGWRMVEQARHISGAGALEIHLAPLSTEDNQQLVSNLLAAETLPAEVRTRILDKTEGNPFFVEEVLSMLIDRGLLVQEGDRWVIDGSLEAIDIPDTLQGVLTARIDRLPDEAKRTLQVAAVIGRRFQVRVLEDVMEETAHE